MELEIGAANIDRSREVAHRLWELKLQSHYLCLERSAPEQRNTRKLRDGKQFRERGPGMVSDGYKA